MEEQAAPDGGRIRVLVADDHPVVRAGLASVLAQEADFDLVGEARDGAEAVELTRSQAPDVVLMDLRMPVMDGVRATEQISRELPRVRVLALSSYGSDGDVRGALRAGAQGYLLKDMLLSQVVGAVRAVHGGARVLPAPIAERLAEDGADGRLTRRELQVLELVARGLGNKEVAAAIGRSDETVKAHLKNVFAKLGVADRTEAVTAALARGVLHLTA
jgi:DNA-binding NarL/FixJ family response regulator